MAHPIHKGIVYPVTVGQPGFLTMPAENLLPPATCEPPQNTQPDSHSNPK